MPTVLTYTLKNVTSHRIRRCTSRLPGAIFQHRLLDKEGANSADTERYVFGMNEI